jgi:ribonuclease H / adenosylcobalamin/alpha-ribazole phosphatase
MTPVELLAKIASLVPPPKRPLLLLTGVLGPGSSWRASVVPHGARVARHAHAVRGSAKSGGGEEKTRPAHAGGAAATGGGNEEKTRRAQAGGGAAKTGGEEKARPVQGSGSARTWLGHGVVRQQGARIDWASLLKRVFLAGCAGLPVWRPAPNRERRARALRRDRDPGASGVAHGAASARTGAGPSPEGVRVRGGAAAAEGALAGTRRRGAGGGAPSTGGGGARGRARAA